MAVPQTNAPAASATASMGDAAAAVHPQPPQADVKPPSNKSAAGKKSDGRLNRSAGDGESEASWEPGTWRRRAIAVVSSDSSDACRHVDIHEGRTYMLMFTVVMAVFWFNYMADS